MTGYIMSVTRYEWLYKAISHIILLKYTYECIKTHSVGDEVNSYQLSVCWKHYSELHMSSQRPIHWCIKVTDWTDLSSSGRSFWLNCWNGHYRCWCIICLQYLCRQNGLCATWFDLIREAAVFLHAPDKLPNECNQNTQRCHACIAFMSKALLINVCIDFIYYSHNVLFYALLNLHVSCLNVNVSPVTRPVLPCVYINVIKTCFDSPC